MTKKPLQQLLLCISGSSLKVQTGFRIFYGMYWLLFLWSLVWLSLMGLWGKALLLNVCLEHPRLYLYFCSASLSVVCDDEVAHSLEWDWMRGRYVIHEPSCAHWISTNCKSFRSCGRDKICSLCFLSFWSIYFKTVASFCGRYKSCFSWGICCCFTPFCH